MEFRLEARFVDRLEACPLARSSPCTPRYSRPNAETPGGIVALSLPKTHLRVPSAWPGDCLRGPGSTSAPPQSQSDGKGSGSNAGEPARAPAGGP